MSLFLAGIVPGLLLGLALMVVTYVIAARRGYPSGAFPGWRPLGIAFMRAVPGLLSAVIIVGGILSGIFTATESSAIAVVYTVVVAALVYRSLSWPKFVAATRNAVKTTAIVMLIISAASAFGWLMAVAEVPLRMSEALLSISDNPLVLILIINLILLILGTFMDMAPLIIITTPIFLPVVTELGMDPVQFGVVMILNLGIGLVTLPWARRKPATSEAYSSRSGRGLWTPARSSWDSRNLRRAVSGTRCRRIRIAAGRRSTCTSTWTRTATSSTSWASRTKPARWW